MSLAPQSAPAVTRAAATSREEAQAWSLLRGLAQAAPYTDSASTSVGLRIDAFGRLQETSHHDAWIVARPDLASGWSSPRRVDEAAANLLDLYMPLCVGERSSRLMVAHLGQSSDGHVATFCGTSKFITGADDVRHTHRLRALFDVVLVGASTVAIDDPMLTTRLVPGKTPVRVVLDPQARLEAHHTVFRDRAARTLVVVDPARRCTLPAHIESLAVRKGEHGFDLHELVERLNQRGWRRIFIEGGAVTVSHFLRARLLDRMQLAVAPVVLGPGPAPLVPMLTPNWLSRSAMRVRRFALGADVLFDGELAPATA
jgi:diaminohydroxyphosphoribosylaminopyrimidine deaminase/5-amino-6-(5-phosphoribosylamino)uracil reductase